MFSGTIFYNRRNSKFRMYILEIFKDKIFQKGAEEKFLSVDIVDSSTTLLGHIVVVKHVLKLILHFMIFRNRSNPVRARLLSMKH